MQSWSRRIVMLAGACALAGGGLSPALAFEHTGASWPEGDRPLAYTINVKDAPQGFEEAIKAAAASFGTDTRFDFSFRYAGASSLQQASWNDGQHVVYWNAAGTGMDATTLATTFHWRRDARMVHFDMAFNGQHRWSTNPGNFDFDIQSVALHEFGHACGMDHSDQWAAVMYRSTPPGVRKRVLHADDVAGLAALYPPRRNVATPGPVQLIAPSGEVIDRRPVFTWQATTNADSYALSVDRLVGASRVSVFRLGSLRSTQFQPSAGLTPGFTYTWQVTAHSASGQTSTSQRGSFQIRGEQLGQPVVASPGRETNVLRPIFSWHAVGGATQYQVWINEVNGAAGVVQETLTTNRLQPGFDLKKGQIYHWWVRAGNGQQWGAWTPNVLVIR